MEHLRAAASAGAGLAARNGFGEQAALRGRYEVVCHGRDGRELWRDEIRNLITTAGKNDLWDKYLAGSGYTAAWYLGLVNSGASFDAGDTMSSHSGWTENQNYDEATRVAVSWSSASSGSKASSGATFTISANSQNIAGVFLTTGSAKGGTTGVLFSAGAFTLGTRGVNDGDTLTVTYTASA